MFGFDESNLFRNRELSAKEAARERMAKAALILAVISVPLCMTGYFSLMTGGIAFLLAHLTLGTDQTYPRQAKIALVLSAACVAFSVALIVGTFTRVILPALRDEVFRAELREYFLNNYGMDIDPLFSNLSAVFGTGD